MSRNDEHRLAAGTSVAPIVRYRRGSKCDEIDLLAVEEALSVSILLSGSESPSHLGITMRTPGDDRALVAGMLFTEGIVDDAVQILDFDARRRCRDRSTSSIVATVATSANVQNIDSRRVGYRSSACGVCGSSSSDALLSRVTPVRDRYPDALDPDWLVNIEGALDDGQRLFRKTGGMHSAALVEPGGGPLLQREDVGRHNAVDKVIGSALMGGLAFQSTVLFLSGRAGFELLQKAARAGIPAVASVGAPSSLAVEVARRADITLIGFLRNGGFNVYTAGHRVRSARRSTTKNSNADAARLRVA